MNDKELIQKLSVLKQIKPDSSWKGRTRDILLSQASNAVATEFKINILEKVIHDLKASFSFVPRAAWAVACVVFILTGGSFSAYAAKNSRPGDRFYTLKAWKEKVQLAATFNQEEKAKLDMKLASIHALEISKVLADPSFNRPGNEKKAEELTQNFKEQINIVKSRLSEMNKIQENNLAAKAVKEIAKVIEAVKPVSENNNDDIKVGVGGLKRENDGKVYGVEAGKNSQGIQVYDPGLAKATASSSLKIPAPAINGETSASSSVAVKELPPQAVKASSSAEANFSDKIKNNLDLATESFDTKDFTGAKNILEQVGVIIENIDNGQVKGETEAGTSTKTGDAPVNIGVGSSSGNK